MSDTQPPSAQSAPPTADAFRVLETELVVSNEGEDFCFRIPTPLDTVRMGLVMRRLQGEIDPEGEASSEGLDPFTVVFLQVLALFLTCLVSTSAKWVHKAGPDGKPTVDWKAWDQKKTPRLLQIWADYQTGMSRFHERSAGAAEPKAPTGG